MTNRLILFDFDETYYKHRTNQADIPYLKEMESLLQNITAKNNVITAILTGSTIESVLKKMSKVNMSYKPQHILDILKHVSSKHKVEFIPQRIFRENETLYNFYLYSSGDTHLDKTILEDLSQYSKTRDYTMTFNRCNPLAGDPENAYDINFTPKNAGKLYATKFLMNKYGVPKELIIGFGDSGNDEAFLSYLDHAMIMSNSQDEEMKSKFKNTKYPYYKGIYTHVREFIEYENV